MIAWTYSRHWSFLLGHRSAQRSHLVAETRWQICPLGRHRITLNRRSILIQELKIDREASWVVDMHAPARHSSVWLADYAVIGFGCANSVSGANFFPACYSDGGFESPHSVKQGARCNTCRNDTLRVYQRSCGQHIALRIQPHIPL